MVGCSKVKAAKQARQEGTEGMMGCISYDHDINKTALLDVYTRVCSKLNLFSA